jgi:hypothetical protein
MLMTTPTPEPAPFVGPPPPRTSAAAVPGFTHEESRPAGLHPALKYGPAAAHLADALSTLKVIQGGGRELDPVLEPFADNPAALVGTKVIGGLAMGLLADLLAKKGHRNWAKAAAGLNIGVPLGAAGLNLSGAVKKREQR